MAFSIKPWKQAWGQGQRLKRATTASVSKAQRQGALNAPASNGGWGAKSRDDEADPYAGLYDSGLPTATSSGTASGGSANPPAAVSTDPYADVYSSGLPETTVATTDNGGLVRPIDWEGRISQGMAPTRGVAAYTKRDLDPNDLLYNRKTIGAYDLAMANLPAATASEAAYDANNSSAESKRQESFLDRQVEEGAPQNSQTAFDAMMASGAPRNSQQAYADARGGLSADMRGYYDRAFSNASEQLNRQMAMRGLANSGAANMGLNRLASDLYGEYAKSQAQYGLDRAKTLGQLGNYADAASTDYFSKLGTAGGVADAAGTNWTDRIGGLYGDVDDRALDRFDALMRGASTADAAENDRAQTVMGVASTADASTRAANQMVFDETSDLAAQNAETVLQTIQDAMGWDDATFDQQMALQSGKNIDEVANERAAYARTGKAAAWYMELVKSVMGGAKGGSGGGK